MSVSQLFEAAGQRGLAGGGFPGADPEYLRIMDETRSLLQEVFLETIPGEEGGVALVRGAALEAAGRAHRSGGAADHDQVA